MPSTSRSTSRPRDARSSREASASGQKSGDGNEGRNKTWALVGAQSILCTMAFLALLYLNYKIWHQYFFLILWAFILSHAFKSTLDSMQDWAENLASAVRFEPRKSILCSLFAGVFRQDKNKAKAQSKNKRSVQGGKVNTSDRTWISLPTRFAFRILRFAGSYGFYFLGISYLIYWLKNHYLNLARQNLLYRVCSDIFWIGCLSAPALLVIVVLGGERIATCISCCCGDKHKYSDVPSAVRDKKLVNPCGSKLLIFFTILYSISLSSVMVLHSLFDIADLGSMVYKAGPSFNFTESQVREKLNSVLEPPLETAREVYENQTWWPIVEVAWKGVKSGKTPQIILERVNGTAAEIYGHEEWWTSVKGSISHVHGWISSREEPSHRKDAAEVLKLSETVKSDDNVEEDRRCAEEGDGEGAAAGTKECAMSLVEGPENHMDSSDQSAWSFDSTSLWKPLRNSYRWISDHNAVIVTWAEMSSGVLGGAIGILLRFADFIGATIGFGLTCIVFFLFLDTMMTNQVDELRVVVLLLYPVASFHNEAGRNRIANITDSLRKAFEGILFVPLSLSSLYASHQLVSMTLLGLPGAGLACTLTFLLSLTQLLSVGVGFAVAIPWIVALFITRQFYLMVMLILFHLCGVLKIEKLVMSANRRLDRVKSPYLTAFALYLGWSVFGLQGLLVGPLGLSIMAVLYEIMAETIS